MGRLSGMEISSSPGLKIPLKLAHGQKILPPKGRRPTVGKVFSHGLILEGFWTRGMKKFSYLTTTAHSEIVFLFESIYAQIEHPTLFWQFFSKKSWNCRGLQLVFMIFSKKIVKTWRFTEFLHGGSCGNQIFAWGVMQKSDSFSVVLWRFHEFFKGIEIYQWPSLI
jgi:hypothetical protein